MRPTGPTRVLAAFAAAGVAIGLPPTPPSGPPGPTDAEPIPETEPFPEEPSRSRPPSAEADPTPAAPAGPIVPPAAGRGKPNWNMCVLVDGHRPEARVGRSGRDL